MQTTYSVFETVLQVRPDDIDMHRHVHNSRYLDYVLAARFDQMERCYGLPMQAFHDRGVTWFVKAAHIEHHRALRVGEQFRVRTGVGEIGKRQVRVLFEIVRLPDERLSAEGYFDYLFVDLESGRPRIIPAEIAEHYAV